MPGSAGYSMICRHINSTHHSGRVCLPTASWPGRCESIWLGLATPLHGPHLASAGPRQRHVLPATSLIPSSSFPHGHHRPLILELHFILLFFRKLTHFPDFQLITQESLFPNPLVCVSTWGDVISTPCSWS